MKNSPQIVKNTRLSIVLQDGEGQSIEFKRSLEKIDREMVAFANASGGSIFIGIDDNGSIVGVSPTNRLLSQIHDIGRNCDPPLNLKIQKHENIIEVVVPEGKNKPYSCHGGFYLRIGPTSQKLSRDEISRFAIGEGRVHFDEEVNSRFEYPAHFSKERYDHFCKLTGISLHFPIEDVLQNINAAEKQAGRLLFTNAAILFFAKDPQHFFPEAYITAVRYRGDDRYAILDRKDMKGDPIAQIEEAFLFCKRHTQESIVIAKKAQHLTVEDYPVVAVREAIVNAVMHRDYFYDSSHTYIHLFDSKMEIENPGGLFPGLHFEDLGKRSVRRNRLLADLLFRAKFIEMVGSGVQRIYQSLKENGNPPPEIQATNFFRVLYKKRVTSESLALTARQRDLLHFMLNRGSVTKSECAAILKTSEDTALREIKALLRLKLIEKRGTGKSTRYVCK